MKKLSIFTIFILSIIFSQSNNTHIWSGISVSTSDNLDALNLNPAGLGVSRGNQYAIVFNEIPGSVSDLSLIHISEPTRPERIGVAGVWV